MTQPWIRTATRTLSIALLGIAGLGFVAGSAGAEDLLAEPGACAMPLPSQATRFDERFGVGDARLRFQPADVALASSAPAAPLPPSSQFGGPGSCENAPCIGAIAPPPVAPPPLPSPPPKRSAVIEVPPPTTGCGGPGFPC